SVDLLPRPPHRRSGCRPRERRLAPSAPRLAALGQPAAAPPMGSGVLGMPVAGAEILVLQLAYRSAGHRPRLAPAGGPAPPALALGAGAGRPANDRRATPDAHSAHGSREPDVGTPTHPGGTSPPWL